MAVVGLGVATLMTGCAARSDFKLESLDGQSVSLSGQSGKAVLLTFWAAG
jgi:peroxiredoxin